MAEDNVPGEVAEQPVREQLKKANIGGSSSGEVESETAEAAGAAAAAGEKTGDAREQIESGTEAGHVGQTAAHAAKHHTRKRSRDSTLEEDEVNNGRKMSNERGRDSVDEARETNGAAKERTGTPETKGPEEVSSPKIKRSRVHSSTEENGTVTQETAAEKDETKDRSASKVPANSGFANTSAASSFGALAGSKSREPAAQAASQSAFASSGFGALAGASTSGFGAVGKASGGFGLGGSFATSAQKSSQGNDKPKEGLFGGALGQKSAFASTGTASSGFGSGASGFGKLGASTGGFGGAAGSGFGSLGAVSGGGLTSFASGKPLGSLAPLGGKSSKPAKPFGAPNDDEDDADDQGDNEEDPDGHKSPLSPDDTEKQDERFYKQELETGEEGEDTIYTCRAKLYNFAADSEGKKEWRERGLGTLRLNVTRDTSEKPKARFLMRADGSHRVVLNTPIKKDLKFGSPDGKAPDGSYMYFMGTIGDSAGLELLQVKMRAQFALELYEKITELQRRM